MRSRSARHFVRCVKTAKLSHRLRLYARHFKAAHFWQIRFHRLPLYWQGWARRITACESGWRQGVVNASGHYSYFQWSLSTWYAAGGHGDPRGVSWYEQAVIAVRWAHVAGVSQWECRG